MKSYITKKVKKICSMPGCREKETWLISRSRDLTGSIFLCKDCLAAVSELYSRLTEEANAPKVGDGGENDEKP